jgi:hypothetical protein
MVPAARSPNRRVAAVLLVAENPTITEQRATAMAASSPWQRRMAKSISCASPAASRQRAGWRRLVFAEIAHDGQVFRLTKLGRGTETE